MRNKLVFEMTIGILLTLLESLKNFEGLFSLGFIVVDISKYPRFHGNFFRRVLYFK